MKMIVGLGNIGKEYDSTRHNVGFMILDSFGLSFSFEKKFEAFISICLQAKEKIIFVKPTTYMNLSGRAVKKIANYYEIFPEDILVIHDDLDLPFGKLKMKKMGSSGGHRGIQSIIDYLGTENFCRLKIGIAHDKNIPTVDYVLGHFSKSNLEFFEKNFDNYKEIVNSFVEDGIDITMGKVNVKD